MRTLFVPAEVSVKIAVEDWDIEHRMSTEDIQWKDAVEQIILDKIADKDFDVKDWTYNIPSE